MRAPCCSGYSGSARARGQEQRAAAAEHDLDAVAVRELDELARDVGKAGRARVGGQLRVVLPVAAGRVGVAGGGRRVGDARGGDDAGREAAVLGLLEQRRDARRPATLASRPRTHASRRRPITPGRVFTPVTIAVIVAADSETWKSACRSSRAP